MRSPQRAERYYAHARDPARKANVYVHRLILNPPPDLLVDHVNGDGLDNRRTNIRVATRSQNNANSNIFNPLGYRGVCLVPSGRFKATISDRERAQKSRYIGTFDTPSEAARAYDAAALERFGEFARLNFPLQRRAA